MLRWRVGFILGLGVVLGLAWHLPSPLAQAPGASGRQGGTAPANSTIVRSFRENNWAFDIQNGNIRFSHGNHKNRDRWFRAYFRKNYECGVCHNTALPVDDRQGGIEVLDDLDSLGGRADQMGGQDLGHQRIQRVRLKVRRAHAALDSREREQVFDELPQAPGLVPQDPDIGADPIRAARLGEQIEIEQDIGDGGAKLVRDVGDEHALEPIELHEPGIGLFEGTGSFGHPMLEGLHHAGPV